MTRDPRIVVLATGTPFYPPDRLLAGLGGNEATLVCWWRALRKRGIAVQVVLGAPAPGTEGPTQADIAAGWRSAETAGPVVGQADVLIAWRNANLLH